MRPSDLHRRPVPTPHPETYAELLNAVHYAVLAADYDRVEYGDLDILSERRKLMFLVENIVDGEVNRRMYSNRFEPIICEVDLDISDKRIANQHRMGPVVEGSIKVYDSRIRQEIYIGIFEVNYKLGYPGVRMKYKLKVWDRQRWFENGIGI